MNEDRLNWFPGVRTDLFVFVSTSSAALAQVKKKKDGREEEKLSARAGGNAKPAKLMGKTDPCQASKEKEGAGTPQSNILVGKSCREKNPLGHQQP